MKILDYIFFSRPILILPIFTIMLLGMRAASLEEGAGPFISSGFPHNISQILLVMLYTFLMCGAAYIYNQINDIESDKANGKLYFLPQGIISNLGAYVLVFGFAAISMIGTGLHSFSMGLVFMAMLITGFLYSHPKTNYKGRAGKALWSNIIGCGTLPFLIGWVLVTNSITMEAVLKSVPYMMAVAAIYFNTTLPDRDGDRKVGKRTYGVIWSTKRVQTSALIRIVLAVLTALMAGDFAIFIGALLALPFFVHALVKREIKDSTRASIVSILILTVFACIYFPLYIPIFVVIILATRIYYQKRFDIAYPSL